MPTSWAPEVFVDGKWSRNGVRFATEKEALSNASDLMSRWFLVEKYRATEADDPVNYRWDAALGLVSTQTA
jgi:hypothetical protein